MRKMNIGLIDVDGHNFPNLALMKLSAWHKARGDRVGWYHGFEYYDRVYIARVFTNEYSGDVYEPTNTAEIVKGGTGCDNFEFRRMLEYERAIDGIQDGLCFGSPGDAAVWQQNTLTYAAEHTYPDYGLYPQYTKDTAYGFLTRGCPSACKFCIVSEKEGRKSIKTANLSEFWRGQKTIKLLDANLLACYQHEELLQQLIQSGAWVDFTQGLDAQCITTENVKLLARVKTKMVHFALDGMGKIDTVTRGLKLYMDYTKSDYRRARVYILTNFDTTHEQDMERIKLVQSFGYKPYVMIYNKSTAPQITRHLQRWSNNPIIYSAQPDFEKYDCRIG